MTILLVALIVAILILATVGWILARKPLDVGPPPEPFTLVDEPMFVARKTVPGHTYRMRLPDRQKMDLR